MITLTISNVDCLSLGMIITMTHEDKPKQYKIVRIEIPSNTLTIIPNTIWARIKYTIRSVFYSLLIFPYWLINPDKAMVWVDRKVYGG
jgi:hypothetical protein